MQKYILLFIFFSLFAKNTVCAQVNDGPAAGKKYKHGIGAAAGFVTGYGLSYRHLYSKSALQVTFAPYVQGKDSKISTGFAILKDMYLGDTSKLFIYSGLHYWYNRYTEKDDENDITVKGDWTDQWLNCGFGPGFEFNLTGNIVFDLMAGYAVYFCDNEPTRLDFTGETALFFYFE